MASGKVVRVEQVDLPDDERPDSLLEESNDGQIHHKSKEPVPQSAEEQVGDQLIPLPEGWPHIQKLQDKQSWDYTNTISPSVNKATAHLELLQNVIEEWISEVATNTKRTPADKHRLRKPGDSQESRKQMKFAEYHEHGAAPTDLVVTGVGSISEEGDRIAAVVDPSGTEENLPYLGAEEVIEEVVTLLAKLESDRKDTLEFLTRERGRYTTLQENIDKYSKQRMTELPLAVQKEHEDCAMDISELNWHVAYKGRIEKRNKNKVTVAETLNARLKEDIEFVNQHIPLVMEKLDLELEGMERIRQAQMDTNEELDTTMQRCSNVEAKSIDAHTKAEQERIAIKKDLDNVRDDLTKISQELADAKMTFSTYTHQCNDNRQQLQDNDQELKVLLVKDETTKATEAMQAVKVRDLETRIKKTEFEQRTLDADITKKQAEIRSNKAKFTKKEKDMKDSITNKKEVLRLLTRENDELTMDNDDMENKAKDCNRQKTADEKNLERMRRALDTTEEQTSMTKDDLANVSIINSATRDQLQNEEEKCMSAEDALRTTTEGLKKQVKEELHSKTVLSARIHSDGNDLTKTQDEVEQKKSLADKKKSEVNNAVKNILGKVEKLREFHKEKQKMRNVLQDELKSLTETRNGVANTCGAKLNHLAPTHKQLKEELQTECKKLDHIEWKTDMMNKKIKEMDEASAMMLRALEKTKDNIAILDEDLKELNMQIDSGQHIVDDLTKSLKQVTGRVVSLETSHTHHSEQRHKVLQDHQKSFDDNMALNKEVASKYRRLQHEFVALKNKMLDKYDTMVKLENAVKDLKQLQGLQKRMHAALLEYLKFRGLYNQGELKRMEEQSQGNGVKVGDLQGQMDGALDTIADFLQHQMDGDSIRRIAMEKVEREEKEQLAAQSKALDHKAVPIGAVS